jgi:hypothetical protein
VDRRFAVLAAGAEALEDPDGYRTDVFTGPRPEGYELNVGLNYVRHYHQLAALSVDGVLDRYGDEIYPAAKALPGRRSENLAMFGELLVRAAGEVTGTLKEVMKANVPRLLSGDLPDSSLVQLVAGKVHLQERWVEYAERLVRVLEAGLPAIVRNDLPKIETDLQRLCDGLLRGAGEVLAREYPYHRWGSRLTKPDWSDESAGLWVELKYVRESRHVREIVGQIAADVTTYGASGRRTLFVVFDPRHLIDDPDFLSDVDDRPQQIVRILR